MTLFAQYAQLAFTVQEERFANRKLVPNSKLAHQEALLKVTVCVKMDITQSTILAKSVGIIIIVLTPPKTHVRNLLLLLERRLLTCLTASAVAATIVYLTVMK